MRFKIAKFSWQKRRLTYLYDLLSELVATELRLLYKRSVLGIAWTLINPLLQLLVFYSVFRAVLTLDIPHYASFVFCGLLVWNWFYNSLIQGAAVIIFNATLIRQPGFPISILPIVVVTTGMVHFCLALPILTIFLLLEGVSLQPLLLELPILIALQFAFTVGLIYILAAINVTLRDTRYTVSVLLQMGFYLTPIFYDLNDVPANYLPFYKLNPMVHLVNSYRDLLIWGRQPDWLSLLILAAITIGLLPISHRFFTRQSHHFVEEI